jgi:hypothetical protein
MYKGMERRQRCCGIECAMGLEAESLRPSSPLYLPCPGDVVRGKGGEDGD